MKLAQILLLKYRNVKPLRRLTSGRNRLPREVGPGDKKVILENLAREEENLFYLSQPYLTPEQNKIWVDQKSQEAVQNEMQMRHDLKLSRMPKHVSFDDRLEHLKVREAWE